MPTSVTAQAGPTRNCHVQVEDAAGTWHVDRELGFDDGKPLSEYDEFDWKPNTREQLAEGLTLRTSLAIRARVAEPLPKVFAGSDTAIDMSFYAQPRASGDAPNDPGYLFLHFYRSSDPAVRKSVFDVSLSTRMFTNLDRTGSLGMRAVLPLEDLLVFGEGRDVLVWNVRSKPDEVGRTNSLLEGTLPVGAIRARIARIPELRRALDRKATNFRKECPELEEAIPVTQATVR